MNLASRKIFVTGGAGFIGSHIVQELLKRDCKVVCYDILDDDFYPGKEENVGLLSANSNFHLIRKDILDYPSLRDAMRGSDIILHEAGQAGVRYCNEKPMKANRVNVEGTLYVLMSAREVGIKEMVYASSSSVFGDPKYIPMDEEHPTRPNSPYGVSKLAGELYCLAFGKVYGIDVSCLRYFSVYGPRGRPDQVIYAFAEKIARGERPVIYGDGEQTRDFTYVSDIVDATILAAEKVSERASGEVFNLGHGSKISMNDLARLVIIEMGQEGRISPIYAERSKGDFMHTEANSAKARSVLGWVPKVPLEVGLKHFLKWYTSSERVTRKVAR